MTIKKAGSSAGSADIRKSARDDHRNILALFQLYLSAPADSRQAIVDQIFHTGSFDASLNRNGGVKGDSRIPFPTIRFAADSAESRLPSLRQSRSRLLVACNRRSA